MKVDMAQAMLSAYISDMGIKQVALCKKTGVKEAMMSNYLNLVHRMPLDVYLRICDALDVPADKFHLRRSNSEKST